MATKNTKKILINAAYPEEVRIALLEGQTLFDYHSEHAHLSQTKDNIYLGTITRVEPGLEAVFVKYSSNAQIRQGFLPLKEIHPHYFNQPIDTLQGKINIKDVISEGTSILVQVDKEERGNKGAALTTFISLAGSYLVLMPNNPRPGGISKQIDGAEREELKKIMSTLPIPEGMGVIARTSCIGKTESELQYDLEYLTHQWNAIQTASQEHNAPTLIYQEDVITRAIRDYVRKDTDEIWIDEPSVHEKVEKYLKYLRPDCADRIKSHEGPSPLFTAFEVEQQIEVAHQREVRLRSGGTLVIDRTEALVSIDVNSAQATRGADIAETALNTNLEAAAEIARQLRLRDLGGLIVIDFIDMSAQRHRREVEEALEKALSNDRARVQISRISRFGLLEMSRQRIRSALGETSHIPCPRCNGQGTIRHIYYLALSMIRLLEDSAIHAPKSTLALQVPVDLATYLMNERRDSIQKIEQLRHCKILILPNPHLETPHYRLSYLNETTGGGSGVKAASHQLIEAPILEYEVQEKQVANPEPVVKGIPLPGSGSPLQRHSEGLLQKIWGALFRKKSPAAQPSTVTPPAPPVRRPIEKSRPPVQGTRPPQRNTQIRTDEAGAPAAPRSRSRGRRNNRNRSSRGPDRRTQTTTPIAGSAEETSSSHTPMPVVERTQTVQPVPSAPVAASSQPVLIPTPNVPVAKQTTPPPVAAAPEASAVSMPAPTQTVVTAMTATPPETAATAPAASKPDGQRRRNANYLRHGRRNKTNPNTPKANLPSTVQTNAATQAPAEQTSKPEVSSEGAASHE